MEINDPLVVDAVTRRFVAYEAALVANDVDMLDDFFWSDPAVLRYGFDDVQHGFAEVSTFRRSLPRQTAPRRLVDTEVLAIGPDAAVVNTEFVLDGTDGPRGRQSQVWARMGGAWRIVSAHVSWPAPASGPDSR